LITNPEGLRHGLPQHHRALPLLARTRGLAPKALGHTHPRWRSPHIASLTQTVVAAIIIGLFAVFTGTDNPNSQAYPQLYGLMAVMGVIMILPVQALVSLAILIYYERFHRDEVNWRRTGLAP
jgi:amino acid transporter